MFPNRWLRGGPAGALLLAATTACDGGTGVDGPLPVSLSFRVASAPAPAAVGPSLAPGPALIAGPPLVLDGINGTLTIEEILIIINEVQLKRGDGSCDQAPGGDDCSEFEAPPRFLDLPLDGTPIDAVVAMIPAGTYQELDFEIEDLEDDESDPAEAAGIATVRAHVLAVAPDWPDEASVLIRGSFTPAGGAPADFRVYLKAEIEIEMELQPNLVVDDGGTANRELTVDVAPQIWFGNPDGTVVDLRQYDFDTTQQLLEFELEIEDGFTQVEIHH